MIICNSTTRVLIALLLAATTLAATLVLLPSPDASAHDEGSRGQSHTHCSRPSVTTTPNTHTYTDTRTESRVVTVVPGYWRTVTGFYLHGAWVPIDPPRRVWVAPKRKIQIVQQEYTRWASTITRTITCSRHPNRAARCTYSGASGGFPSTRVESENSPVRTSRDSTAANGDRHRTITVTRIYVDQCPSRGSGGSNPRPDNYQGPSSRSCRGSEGGHGCQQEDLCANSGGANCPRYSSNSPDNPPKPQQPSGDPQNPPAPTPAATPKPKPPTTWCGKPTCPPLEIDYSYIFDGFDFSSLFS